MVTLKLKKKPGTGANPPAGGAKRPLRSSGVRTRPTLAQAQQERAEREAAYDSRAPRGNRPEPSDRPAHPRRDERYAAPERDRPQPAWDREGRPLKDRRDRPADGDRRDGRPFREGSEGPDRFQNGPRRAGPPDRSGPWDRTPAPRGPQASGPSRRPDPRFNEDSNPGPAVRPRRDLLPPARPVDPNRAAPHLRSVANRRLAEQLDPGTAPARPPRPEALGVATEGERLSKRMTALGLASRREADEWIEAGWVRVNGKLAVLGQRVVPGDDIQIDPAAHREQARRVTILLNKPVGHVSGQPEDDHPPAVALIRPENQWEEDKTGRKWHPGHLRSLAPAGRLDIDSVGLLVLTQDGRLARQLIGEDSSIEKEYLVRVAYKGAPARLPDSDLALLNHGLELDGQELKPAKVSWQNEDQLRFVLKEGKKRQIRRMCEAVGLEVLGLKRVRIGSVVLGKLPPGQWRYLRDDERF